MSEATTSVEKAVDAVVETTVEASAPVVEAVTTAVAPVKAKRAYKKRAPKSVVAAVAAPVAKATRKVRATVARRKYVRNTTAAIKQVAAPLIKGNKTMAYEAPNWFANFTAVPGADKFQSMFSDVGAKGQDAMRKSQLFAEQVTEAAKANVEAMVESTKIATAGVRDLGQEVVASTKTGVDHASTAVKSLAEAKSPTEFFQLQSEMMKSSFDRMVSEGSKFTEHMVKLTGEAIQPLSNRASVSAEKFSELTA